jgi:hypothetical protein
MKIPGAAYHELVAMYFDLPEDWPGCLWVEIEEGERLGMATCEANKEAAAYAERHATERLVVMDKRNSFTRFRFPLYLRPGMTALDFNAAVIALPREEARAMGRMEE